MYLFFWTQDHGPFGKGSLFIIADDVTARIQSPRFNSVASSGSESRPLCGNSFRASFGTLRFHGAACSPIGNNPFESADSLDCRPGFREEQCPCSPGPSIFVSAGRAERH